MSPNFDSTKIILQTRNLTRAFDHLVAVNNLDLAIDKGIIFGLLGPNGAGKTTLIKMLITLLKPTSGEAYIDGINVEKNPRAIRSLIGYVPQSISADGALTGYENLMFSAKLYNIPRKIRKQRVKDSLELMGLSEVADKLVSTYSGGMIRRLEVVQAMLHQPKILFLDEPTIGLDVVAKNTLWEYLLSAHQALGSTVFITTHDMNEADKLCEEIAIMDHGKIILLGQPVELKKKAKRKNATLEDVYIELVGGQIEHSGDFSAVAKQRRTYKLLR
jgi:ABC-2 type transport system ATP-binding protein